MDASVFISIFIATFLISLASFAGALILLLKEKILDKILLLLVSFSAGALIGAAFLNLIPEAINLSGYDDNSLLKIFIFSILGFCVFFILEQFIRWHHHHSTRHETEMPFSYLILISDGLHNFIDGLLIAGAFIVSFPTGFLTSLAVLFHEIPQEISDFSILIYGGIKKIKALFLNFISAAVAILGGIIGFLVLSQLQGVIVFLLPFTAGGFIYIAASDLVPDIKKEKNFKKSALYFIVFLTGISIMALIKILFE